ncbi:hypothetical protein PG985_002555 [Apiospora marii]|uniref:Clr5 domain-containing protein n=1 Tax=Apiospora marii TaxID=335849 RepID=A0ABR1RUF3_9PEZI
MTKDWDNYKETILALYEHQTLAQVMEVMKRDYGFEASTRAYRQKLDKWGKRKYKKRKGKSDNSPDASDADSADDAAGSSISASPQMSRRKGDTHAAASTGYGANAATFQQGDGNYSLNHHGTDASNAYNPAQYPNANAYGAADNSYWAGGYSDTTAQSYSQTTLNPGAAAYGYDGMAYPTDNTATAAPFQYMDTPGGGGGFPMHGQMDYAAYPDGGWDHTQDG